MSEDPKPGSFDWIVGGTAPHTIDIPLDPAAPNKVLRVEVTAKAQIYPSRPWGYIILAWGLAVLVLLYLIAAKPAHAADQWRSYTVGPNTYTESQEGRARTWQEGPNTYTDIQQHDGSTRHCRSYRVGPNTYGSCN